jgi:hypothetical protein
VKWDTPPQLKRGGRLTGADFKGIAVWEDSTSFDYAFMAAIHAVSREPERVMKLFSNAGERGYDMSCYEPVNHTREGITVNFDHVKGYAGDRDIATYQDHWRDASSPTTDEVRLTWRSAQVSGGLARVDERNLDRVLVRMDSRATARSSNGV